MRIRAGWFGLVMLSGALLGVFSISRAANAFSLFIPGGGSSVAEVNQGAGRWSSISGLSDGIQVGANLASDLSAYFSDVTPYNQVLVDAFLAWENPSLQFDISLDDPGVAEGTGSGFEIDVFAVPASHWVFGGTYTFSGYAYVSAFFDSDRPLTNGQSYPGLAISGADIFINIDKLLALASLYGLSESQKLAALQNLFMHEIGHAIGLAHPNSNDPYGVQVNYDTDSDPFNLMVIDPADPFGDLIDSANRDDTAIMSNRPCGEPFPGPCAAIFDTSLDNDDVGGRDALYPIPEPSTGLLVMTGLLGLAYRQRRHGCEARGVVSR